MEILDRQQVRASRGHPAGLGDRRALRAMPVPAGVVGDPDRPAGIARLGMAAQGGGPAGGDGSEGAVLPPGQPLRLPDAGPVGADDVGEFDPAPRGRRAHGSGLRREVQPLQRCQGSPMWSHSGSPHVEPTRR